eukprot:TRINITY_DN73270_c0_g1_i1.p1 TRINITY_DN73270_c0_g1~~TRINITY_DN73270_c0_g1_i1.p1  ORF type:complete len:97 (-),score=28.68 TRINITY_DN73270_c0_g1_i1:27-317(-)
MSVYSRVHSHGVVDTKNLGENPNDDDWETDPDYVNDVSEKDQRWGSKEIVPPKKKGEQVDNIQEIARRATEQDQKVTMDTYYEKKSKSLYGGQKDQ